MSKWQGEQVENTSKGDLYSRHTCSKFFTTDAITRLEKCCDSAPATCY